MKRFRCDEPARGVCSFRGRALRKERASRIAAILTIYAGEANTPKAVVVADGLCCGIGRPQPKPTEMPEQY